jgi:hypothetical protein
MNEKGFGLTEVLMFIVFSLIILVAAVITINNDFSELQGNNTDTKTPTQIIGDEKETKKTEKVIDEKIKKEDSEYQELLDKMTNTAKIYITTNYTGTTDRIIIKTSKLVSDEYMEDLIDPKNSDNVCKGYVIYDGVEEYTPYLNCGENYVSQNYDISFE